MRGDAVRYWLAACNMLRDGAMENGTAEVARSAIKISTEHISIYKATENYWYLNTM